MLTKSKSNMAFIALTITVMYLLEKVSSVGRESFLAYTFGLSSFSDVYVLVMNIPFKLSILIYTLIYFSFVPAFSQFLDQKRERAIFSISFLIWIIFITLLITFLLFLTTPFLVQIFAPGMGVDFQFLAKRLIRSALPIIPFYALAAMFAGINACFKNYIVAYLTKALNLIAIFCFIFIFMPKVGIYILPYALVAGSIVAFISQRNVFPEVYKEKIKINKSVFLFPYTYSVFKTLLPLIAAALILELNLIVMFHLASKQFTGCIAVLNFSYIIVQFFVGLIEAWVLTAVFPILSYDAQNNKITEFYQKSFKYLKMIFFLSFSFLLFTLLFPREIITFLFQRGKFNIQATQVTVKALFGFGIGLIPLALDSLLLKIIYLSKFFKEILYLVTIRVIINIILSFIFSSIFGFWGLPLAFSIALMVNLILTLKFLRYKTGFSFLKYKIKEFFVLALGIAAVIFYTVALRGFISPMLITQLLFGISGIFVYLVILFLLKKEEVVFIKEQLSLSLSFYLSKFIK